MIDEETIWDAIWPVVEALIEATLAENPAAIQTHLLTDGEAAAALALFGTPVFDILLKTVLGRSRLGLTRAVETENGRFVHVEYAWPDPASTDRSYTAADVVTVTLAQTGAAWQIVTINPAGVDLPLTSVRATAVLASTQAFNGEGRLPSEPWILPFALYGGQLQLALKAEGMADDVERALLPGMQDRGFGFVPLLGAPQLWRDYFAAARPDRDPPGAWAAAVEFLMSDLVGRVVTQAAAGAWYDQKMTAVGARARHIRRTLALREMDDRYTDLQPAQIVYNADSNSR